MRPLNLVKIIVKEDMPVSGEDFNRLQLELESLINELNNKLQTLENNSNNQ